MTGARAFGKPISRCECARRSIVLRIAPLSAGVLKMVDVLIVLVVGTVMALSHLIPWELIPGATNERRDLKRVYAYIVGTAIITGGVLLRCIDRSDFTWLWFTLALDVAGFCGAIIPRGVKRLKNKIHEYQDEKDLARQKTIRPGK